MVWFGAVRRASFVVGICVMSACTTANPAIDRPASQLDSVETEPGEFTESISSVVALPDNALFATAADIDLRKGLELIWVDEQETLHAGEWSIAVEVPDAEPYFVNVEAELRALRVDDVPLIVFVHPVEGVEDPPNLYQLFAVTASGLDLVHGESADPVHRDN